MMLLELALELVTLVVRLEVTPSLATKASLAGPLLVPFSVDPFVAGNVGELVSPATYVFALLSTAIPVASSVALPPR